MLGKIMEVFRSLKTPTIFIVLLLTLAIPITVFVALRQQNLKQKAAEKEEITPQNQNKPQFVEGEVIIKLKSQIPKLKVKQEKAKAGLNIDKQSISFADLDPETIPSAIKNINQKYQIKTVDKVFKNVESPRQELDKLKKSLTTQNEQNRSINEQQFLNIDFSHIYKFSFDANTPVEQVVKDTTEEIITNPSIADEIDYVQPNYIYKTDQTQIIPNDTHFHYLYGMHNTGQDVDTLGDRGSIDSDIDAPEAWAITTDASSITVGIIDTGVDYNHEDLARNIWRNTQEIADNSIDDDNNGYIDDARGWDFVNNDNNPMDDHGHGTHIAGTIGAVGNNSKGVVGVSWNVKIIPLKFLDAFGRGNSDDAAKAVHYATMMGAKITNNSWGGGSYDKLLFDAITEANSAGVLLVASAGNSASNNDVYPNYPSNYKLPNIISVAATTYFSDQLASFSNYGSTTVHLGAPGKNILSTYISPKNSYVWFSGTSMAAPHVSGALALAWGQFPSLSGFGMKDKLLGTVDKISYLAEKVISQGRLNVYNLLTQNVFAYSPKSFLFSQSSGGQTIQSSILLTNAGNQQDVSWSIAANVPWITFSQSSGTIAKNTDKTITFLGDVSDLQPNNYAGTITITTNNPSYQTINIPVTLGIQPRITTEWQKKIGDTESHNNYPGALVTDNSGNVYITGTFSGSITFDTTTLTSVGDNFLVKYDSSGNVLWAKQGNLVHFGQMMAIDSQGSTYFFGNFVEKYTSDGNLIWSKQRNLSQTSGGYSGITVDSKGNLYIIGHFSNSVTFGDTVLTASSTQDVFVASYDTVGNPRWIKKTGQDYDTSIGITADHEDNINAVYRAKGVGGKYDGIYLAKYNPDGSVIRDSKIISPSVSANTVTVTAVAADTSNNIVITGYFTGTPTIGSIRLTNPTGLYNLFVGKFNKDGISLWAKGISSVFSNSIKTDMQGNIYVAGYFSGHATFATSPIYIALTSINEKKDAITIKFDSLGNVVWAKQTDFSDDDRGNFLNLDNAGKIYIAGIFSNEEKNGTSDIFIEKLDNPTVSIPTPTATSTPTQTPTLSPTPTITPTPTTPAPVCNACSADVNKNGRVSITDYSLMVTCYDKEATGMCEAADINHTGTIDIEDFGCVIENFGKQCVAPSP